MTAWTGRRPFGRGVHLLALALLGACALVVRTASTFGCPECGSTRRVSQPRIGIDDAASLPLLPVREEIRETDASRDLVGPGHAHRWEYRVGRAGGRFLLSGTWCVNPLKSRPNAFVQSWEENPAFRRHVEAERAAGRLGPDEIAAIARIPYSIRRRDAPDPALAARFARAQALFAACGAPDRDGTWARWTPPATGTAAPRGCPGPTR